MQEGFGHRLAVVAGSPFKRAQEREEAEGWLHALVETRVPPDWTTGQTFRGFEGVAPASGMPTLRRSIREVVLPNTRLLRRRGGEEEEEEKEKLLPCAS